MNKEQILLNAKEELREIVINFSMETLNQDLKQAKSYLSFLESLSELECPVSNDQIPHDKSAYTKEEDQEENVYIFERKLKGGFIHEIEAYVPETVVRELGLTDGDRVRAVPKKTNYKKRQHYYFSLVKKGNGDDGNRETIQYCVVEKDGGLWVCNKTLSGENIRFGDLPFTVRIKESEVQDFNLLEEDIVDIAYYNNNPTVCKVVWKHKVDTDQYTSPLPSGYYKAKTQTGHKTEENPDLKGKNVTIIGCINRHAVYRDQLEALGAICDAMDGTEEEQRIASLIKKSDLVLIIIPAVSHNGAGVAKKHCKENNIPFRTIDSIGTNRVITGAAELAKALKTVG